MTAPVHIEDGQGTKNKAKVTDRGQVIVSPLDFDDAIFKELTLINTAYSFYPPIADKLFVITGMRIKADRSVSNTVDATIIVYEAEDSEETTVTRILHEEALIRGESVTLLPLNIIVGKGSFVNAKTTDNNIYITVFGYYVEA